MVPSPPSASCAPVVSPPLRPWLLFCLPTGQSVCHVVYIFQPRYYCSPPAHSHAKYMFVSACVWPALFMARLRVSRFSHSCRGLLVLLINQYSGDTCCDATVALHLAVVRFLVEHLYVLPKTRLLTRKQFNSIHSRVLGLQFEEYHGQTQALLQWYWGVSSSVMSPVRPLLQCRIWVKNLFPQSQTSEHRKFHLFSGFSFWSVRHSGGGYSFLLGSTSFSRCAFRYLNANPIEACTGAMPFVAFVQCGIIVGPGSLWLLHNYCRHYIPFDRCVFIHDLRVKGPVEAWLYAGCLAKSPTACPSSDSFFFFPDITRDPDSTEVGYHYDGSPLGGLTTRRGPTLRERRDGGTHSCFAFATQPLSKCSSGKVRIDLRRSGDDEGLDLGASSGITDAFYGRGAPSFFRGSFL